VELKSITAVAVGAGDATSQSAHSGIEIEGKPFLFQAV